MLTLGNCEWIMFFIILQFTQAIAQPSTEPNDEWRKSEIYRVCSYECAVLAVMRAFLSKPCPGPGWDVLMRWLFESTQLACFFVCGFHFGKFVCCCSFVMVRWGRLTIINIVKNELYRAQNIIYFYDIWLSFCGILVLYPPSEPPSIGLTCLLSHFAPGPLPLCDGSFLFALLFSRSRHDIERH